MLRSSASVFPGRCVTCVLVCVAVSFVAAETETSVAVEESDVEGPKRSRKKFVRSEERRRLEVADGEALFEAQMEADAALDDIEGDNSGVIKRGRLPAKAHRSRKSNLAPAPSERMPIVTGTSEQVDPWYPMGCFARLGSDDSTAGDVVSVRDTKCQDFNQTLGEVCRSGLPFYRLVSNDLSPGVCKDYCLGKGMDICGLVSGKECRCGVSTRIRELWGRHVLPHLTFQDEQAKLRDGSPVCEIIAYRYIGELEEGAVPAKMLTRTATDHAYIQAVGCPGGNCKTYNDAP